MNSGSLRPRRLSNWFRQQCDLAGLPHGSAHGLRKAAARRLAEAGCTEHEIASITGHRSLQEIVRYTRAADQKRLAVSAMDKVRHKCATCRGVHKKAKNHDKSKGKIGVASPQRIGKAHLPDQLANLKRHRRSSPSRPRPPTPIGSEPRSVPADDGLRPDDRKCISQVRKQSIETDEYRPVETGAVRRRTMN